MYNFKDDIAIPTHNYSTRLKLKSNVIIPKIETVFWTAIGTHNIGIYSFAM